MTITGWLVLCALITRQMTGRFRLANFLLDPFNWVCISYLRFFAIYDDYSDVSVRAVVANALGFAIFSALYFFAATSLGQKSVVELAEAVWPMNQRNDYRELTDTNRLLMISIIGIWAACDLSANTWAYGGLDEALVRFYVSKPVNELPQSVIRIVNVLFSGALAVIFFFRIDAILTGSKKSSSLFWVSVSVFVLITIPKGTVGYVVLPILLMLIADSISIINERASKFPLRVYILVVPCLLSIALLLLTIRSGNYSSLDDLGSALGEVDFTGLNETSNRGHQIVFEYVEMVVNTYGETKEYLYLHTPYSILVNLIPREFWPDKPYGFGRILALDEGASHDSGVSFAAGIAGEGYANGGWFGIVLLAGAVGWLCGGLAKVATVLFRSQSIGHLLLAFLAWYAASSFVRGDMLSAWGQAMYPLVFTAAAMWVAKSLRSGR